ncbi:MAG: 50S ribosomal protein L14 [Patescibacteria group bacterium]
MLQERTILNIADNSGATKVMLFAVNGKNNRRSVGVGDIVVGSVKKSTVGSKVKKGSVVSVLIVRTRKKQQRKDGSSIKFSDNAAVVVNKASKEPVATRVFGPVARELREMGYSKVISLAEEVL